MANMLSMNSKFVVSPYYHGQGHSRLAQILWTPYRPVVRRVLKDADAIIVNSQAAQNTVHTTFAPNCRIFVVYDGVDVQQIQNAKP